MEYIVTEQGKIRRRFRDGYQEYLGIPFAKPPVGDLRWKRPEKPEPYEAVLSADHFPNRCMQSPQQGFYLKEFYEDAQFMPPISEDCLYLNIWTPEDAEPGKNYPVALWIHGGAFMGGFASEMEFDGEAFAKKGVILVSIQYRLGIFGFFAHRELEQENKEHISGNYGIFDQIAAISWVRKNIVSFGGDKDNITIFGQSAGAMSVQTLCSSPLTEGMFTKAILQSGGSYGSGLHTDRTMEKAETLGSEIMEFLGTTSIEEMRKIPADKLLNGFGMYMKKKLQEAGGFENLQLPMIPVIDGYLMGEGYYKTMDAGKLHDIPYLLGSNSEDIPGLTADAVHDFSLKEEEVHGNPAYIYEFNRQMPGDDAGAFHSAELWYVFGTYKRCWRPLVSADAALSERMTRCWTNFMKTGNPGDGWRKYTKQDPYVKTFDI